MDERQRLEQAIEAQESLRGTLEDEFIDAAIAAMKKQIADLETPNETLAQQRKLVTILFADIVGSTEIVKHLDPEDALEIMDGALKRLAIPVEDHGGHVTRFMGDGFKAVFGMHKANENDPEMAIRAGLGIIAGAQELGVGLQNQWGIRDFQVRVGINTGLAALGGMTESEDTVMGSTVNLAARIESAAPPGGVLITHNTYRHVRGVFDVEPQDAIEAKGFDEPIAVYSVLGVKPRAFRVQRRGVEGLETRMVGRKAELIALQEAYNNAIEGEQTQVITVVGEAGVGKSRLLYEFQSWLELLTDEVLFFQGTGRQETQSIPYSLLKDVFVFRFQIQESDDANEMHKKIENGFGEIFSMGDSAQMRAHIIAQLLGFDFSESFHLKDILDDPQQIHDRTLMYMVEYFQGISEQFPVVVFLEDIHWADDSSLDKLNRLARRIPEQRLLIIGLARQRLYERRPHWGEGLAYHRRLELQPLSKYDSNQLVMEIMRKAQQVPDSMQELVVKGAEGNPFYIEELIKMLVEGGVIITGEEQWLIQPDRLAEVQVPDTLTGVLQARLEGLPNEERTTLQQASVIGQTFWDDAVVYLNSESGQGIEHLPAARTIEDLSSLRARELIYHLEESVFHDAAEYSFKHAVLKDVAYESVLKRVRKAYHGLVAEWLIQNSGERAGEYTGLIADHLELAGKQEQAAIYLYQAGERAAKLYANVEAVGYFTRALDLTTEDDLAGRYDLLLAREKVLDVLGDREAQSTDLADITRIVGILNDPRRQLDVHLRQIGYHLNISDFNHLERFIESAIDLAQDLHDVPSEACIRFYWGRFLWQVNKNEAAISMLEDALKMAQIDNISKLKADILRSLWAVSMSVGEADEQLAYNKLAWETYIQLKDIPGEAATLNNLGTYHVTHVSDFQRAQEYYHQALDLFQKIGDRKGEGLVLYNLGEVAFYQLDLARAVDLYSQSADIWEEVGYSKGNSRTYSDLGLCYFQVGDYKRAAEAFEQGLHIAKLVGITHYEVYALTCMANYYCTLGDYERAENWFERVNAIWDSVEEQDIKIKALIHLSNFKRLTGDQPASLEYCRNVLSIIGDRDHINRCEALMCLGHGLIIQGEYEQAEAAYQQAAKFGTKIGRPLQAIEAQAGMVRISLASGDRELAMTQVDEILTYIEANKKPKGSSHPLDGTEEPFRILLTCYQVLKSNDDPRASMILQEAYNLLQERAANIHDENLWYCFLNNVAANREIVEAYEGFLMERTTPS